MSVKIQTGLFAGRTCHATEDNAGHLQSPEAVVGQFERRSSRSSASLSNFSLDSPITTPDSLYRSEPLPSPGWHEASPLCFHTLDRMPTHSDFPCYDEPAGQSWVPSEIPKEFNYDKAGVFPCQTAVCRYPQTTRDYRRYDGSPYSAVSVLDRYYSSRPIVHQSGRIPSMTLTSVNNAPQWMPSVDFLPQQAITLSSTFYQPPLTPVTPSTEFAAPTPSLEPELPTASDVRRSRDISPRARVSIKQYAAGHSSTSASHNIFSEQSRRREPKKTTRKGKSSKQGLALENIPPIIKQVPFKCSEPNCKGRFKRQEHLKRHMMSHSKIKPFICWVPGCRRAFSRSDNLKAHYGKTHSKKGGRNRYVSTLDEGSSDYDPDFRGELTSDGRPVYGSKVEGGETKSS